MELDYNEKSCVLKFTSYATPNSSFGGVVNNETDDYYDYNYTTNLTYDFEWKEPDPFVENMKLIMNSIVLPCLCAFGIIGNILNILVLFHQRKKSLSRQSLESVAITGLLALAISDLCYCICAFPKSFVERGSSTFYRNWCFKLVYTMYNNAITTVFIHTSTWLVAHMAVMRYIAICQPLHARRWVGMKSTIISFAVIAIAAVILNIPSCFVHTVINYTCPEYDVNIYILNQGPLIRNQTLNKVYSNIGFVFGFIVPFCIIGWCHAFLVRGIRASRRSSMNMRIHGKRHQIPAHLTPTLIVVVGMFFLLLTPSAILNFFFYTRKGGIWVNFMRIAIVFAQLLQTVNFSLNFLLYCIFNHRFRTVLAKLLCIPHLRFVKEQGAKAKMQTSVNSNSSITKYNPVRSQSDSTRETMFDREDSPVASV